MRERFKAPDSLAFPGLARFLVGCSHNVSDRMQPGGWWWHRLVRFDYEIDGQIVEEWDA